MSGNSYQNPLGYTRVTEANPKARIAHIGINDKTINTPSYFPILRRSRNPNEVRQIVEAVNRENDGYENPFPHIGGYVFEADLVERLLDPDEFSSSQSVQTRLGEEGVTYPNFHTLIERLDQTILIDPNTDRMMYSDRLDDFIEGSGLSGDLRSIIGDKKAGDYENQAAAYADIRDSASKEAIAESQLTFQNKFNVDLYLAPYLPIDNWNIGYGENEDVWNEDERERTGSEKPFNIQLYQRTAELAELWYGGKVAPVIPLRNSILLRYSTDQDGAGGVPQLWKDIVDEYRKLDPPMIFIKATNAEFDPMKPDFQNNRSIVKFFELLRKWTDNTPLFFLGIGELAYVLMAKGLDAYADPIHQQSFEPTVAITDEEHRPDPANQDFTRSYLVYRLWRREKFNQLTDLSCPGPFCEPFENADLSSLEISDQDSLRTKHWFWIRNDELGMLKEAIDDDQVSIALKDICEDSDWHKNLATFL